MDRVLGPSALPAAQLRRSDLVLLQLKSLYDTDHLFDGTGQKNLIFILQDENLYD